MNKPDLNSLFGDEPEESADRETISNSSEPRNNGEAVNLSSDSLKARAGPKRAPRRLSEKAWKKYNSKSISDLADEEIDQSLYLLGDGWLERGSGGFVVGGSGVGKSVISFQMGILWACGREAFGISSSGGPLRIAIFQAEDGDNDQRRMARMFDAFGLSAKEKELSRLNCRVISCNDLNGDGFLGMIDGYLEDNPTDLL